ncbi:hypothetical protein DFH28DRAFT_981439 [Melampsora americana]|nr:hypothetical protein DFH28DRAFT_981439 [Melampsora americana]
MSPSSAQEWMDLKQVVRNAAEVQIDNETVKVLWIMGSLAPLTCLLYLISLIKRWKTKESWLQPSAVSRQGYLSPHCAITVPILVMTSSMLSFGWIATLEHDLTRNRNPARSEALRIFSETGMFLLGWITAWGAVYTLPPSLLSFNPSRSTKNFTQTRSQRQQSYKPIIFNTIFIFGCFVELGVAIPWAFTSYVLTGNSYHQVEAFNELVEEILFTYDNGSEPGESLVNSTLRQLSLIQETREVLLNRFRFYAGLITLLILIHTGVFLWASLTTLLALGKQKRVIEECFLHRHQLIHLDQNMRTSHTPSPYSETASSVPSGIECIEKEKPIVTIKESWRFQWLPFLRDSSPDITLLWQIPSFNNENDWSAKDNHILTKQYHILCRSMANIKWHVFAVLLIASAYTTFCLGVATNAFQVPQKMSPNDFIILSVRWCTCSWHPAALILGIISCSRAFTPAVSFPKEPDALPQNFDEEDDHHESPISLRDGPKSCYSPA